jgi:hypothetical protein
MKQCVRCAREGRHWFARADDGFGTALTVCSDRSACDLRLWRARPAITCPRCGVTSKHSVSYATGVCVSKRACHDRWSRAHPLSFEERSERAKLGWERRREQGTGGVIVDEAVVKKIIGAYRRRTPMSKIGRSHGVSEDTIKRTLLYHGVKLRPRGVGNRSPMTAEEREARVHKAWTTRRVRGTDKRLSDEEVAEVVRLYKLGLSLKDLSLRFFVGKDTIRRALAERGTRIRPRGGRPNEVRVSDEEVEACARLYTQVDPELGRPLTMEEVGERLGLSETAVQHRLANHAGVPRRKPGDGRGGRRVSEEEIQRTIDLYLHGGPDGLGLSLAEVGEVVGVHFNAVRRRLLTRGVTLRPPGKLVRPQSPEARRARAERAWVTRRARQQEAQHEQDAA